MDNEYSFENMMKGIVEKFKKDYELQDLNTEEFQEKLLNNKQLASSFAQAVLEECNNYGNDIFE
jgi:hypothetical protein